MKDNADSDADPYHSCKQRKHKNIKQGIAAPWKWDVAMLFCFRIYNGIPSVKRRLPCKTHL